MAPRITAYHIYPTPGPRPSTWQCDAADGDDQTIVEGYGKTPALALKNCMKAVTKRRASNDLSDAEIRHFGPRFEADPPGWRRRR